MPVWTNAVNVTSLMTTTGAWTDLDLSAYVNPGDVAVGFIFRIRNDGGSYRYIVFRKNGSTFNVPSSFYGHLYTDSHAMQICGCDTNNIVEYYLQTIGDIVVWLQGYFLDTEATFFTNPPEISSPENNAWNDVDLSGYGGWSSNTKAAVILAMHTRLGLIESCGFRKKGSSDERVYQRHYTTGVVVGLDSNGVFQYKESTGDVSNKYYNYLHGFVNVGSFLTNTIDFDFPHNSQFNNILVPVLNQIWPEGIIVEHDDWGNLNTCGASESLTYTSNARRKHFFASNVRDIDRKIRIYSTNVSDKVTLIGVFGEELANNDPTIILGKTSNRYGSKTKPLGGTSVNLLHKYTGNIKSYHLMDDDGGPSSLDKQLNDSHDLIVSDTSGGVLWQPWGLDFNGGHVYCTDTDILDNDPDKATIFCEFHIDTQPSTDQQFTIFSLVTSPNSSNGHEAFVKYVDESGVKKLYFFFGGNGAGEHKETITLSTKTNYRVGLVKNGSTAICYLDGENLASFSCGTAKDWGIDSVGLTVGRDKQYSNPLYGGIYQFFVLDENLNDDDLSNLEKSPYDLFFNKPISIRTATWENEEPHFLRGTLSQVQVDETGKGTPGILKLDATNGGTYYPTGYREVDIDVSQFTSGKFRSVWTGIPDSTNMDLLDSTNITILSNVSLDSGGSWGGWNQLINGGYVPGITESTPLSQAVIKIKQELYTPDLNDTPQLWSFGLIINQPPSYVVSSRTAVIYDLNIGIWTEIIWALQLGNLLEISWALVLSTYLTLLWGLQQGKLTTLIWDVWLEVWNSLLWSLEERYTGISLVWTLQPEVEGQVSINWDLLEKVQKEIAFDWDIDEATKLSKKSTLNWDLLTEQAGYTGEDLRNQLSILIDDEDITDLVESWNIEINEDNFTNAVELNFLDFALFRKCNVVANKGIERIKIIIGTDIHKFLIEQRDIDESADRVSFNVWGRSKNALLGMPYTAPLTDGDETNFPWQGNDPIMAKTILDWCVSYYNSNRDSLFPTLSLKYDDGTSNFFSSEYLVYPANFTVSSQTLDQIMQMIIDDFAMMVWDYRDEKIHIKFPKQGKYRWDTYLSDSTSFVSYTDIDSIVQLSEEVNYPEGFNYVLVKGVEEPGVSDHFIDMELDEDYNQDTEYNPNEDVFIAVYSYPYGMEIDFETNTGTMQFVKDIVKSVTETLTFEDRKTNTQKPIYSLTSYDWHGIDLGSLSFDQDRRGLECQNDGCGICLVTYVTRYKLYKYRASMVGRARICATEVADA